MANSKKHMDFVKATRDKPATTLPGVGPVTGERLKRIGIFTADDLLAKYISINRKRNLSFEAWFEDTTGANSRQAADCARALDKWNQKCDTNKNAAASSSATVRYQDSQQGRVSLTRRTMTVTEETYQYSRSGQRQVDYESRSSESGNKYYFEKRHYSLN